MYLYSMEFENQFITGGEHHVLWSYSYVPSPVGSHFEPHLPNVEPQ